MTRQAPPFALDLSSRLEAVLGYWRGLRRGEAAIPFADDIDILAVQDLCADVFLLDVFDRPRRFRLALAHTPNAPHVEADLQGRFLDETDMPPPLELLLAQADAVVEVRAPTCHRERRYVRLLLPAWGEGQIRQLLGAIDWL